MTQLRREHPHLTVACDLDAADIGTRVGEWEALRDTYGLGAGTIPGGVRMWLTPDSASIAENLVEREAQCCAFLDFKIARDGSRVRLDITSLAPMGVQVAAFLGGLEHDSGSACC